MIPPSNAGGEGREVLALRTALVDYAMHYGPRCRECADHDDICPMSGMACGERRKATEFVVDALIYGATHGYCPSSLTRARENADDRAPALVEAAVAEMRERAAGHRWIISEARKSLRLVEGCLECNADDERRWRETIEWLEALA